MLTAEATAEATATEDSNVLSMNTVVPSNSIVGTREEGRGGGRTGNIIEPDRSCTC